MRDLVRVADVTQMDLVPARRVSIVAGFAGYPRAVDALERAPDLTVEFTGDVRAPHRSRAAVSSLFRQHPDLLEDVRLVVSELITNAVMHTPIGGVLRVWLLGGGGWRVEVEDHSDRPPEAVTSAREIGGRGLELVALLAGRWGSVPLHEGKVVWAERVPITTEHEAGHVVRCG